MSNQLNEAREQLNELSYLNIGISAQGNPINSLAIAMPIDCVTKLYDLKERLEAQEVEPEQMEKLREIFSAGSPYPIEEHLQNCLESFPEEVRNQAVQPLNSIRTLYEELREEISDHLNNNLNYRGPRM
jgi:hypothetical protein